MSQVDAETYALGLFCEEFGEALQLAGKALRFGIDTPGVKDPLTGEIKPGTPRTMLPAELGDAMAAIDYAIERGVIDGAAVEAARLRKFAKLTNPLSVDNLGRRLAP